MEETAWDTAFAPHPAGCCKDRAAARPDPCNSRGVGHLLRGPAGSGAIGTGPVGEGLGGESWMAGVLETRWQRRCFSSERLIHGAVVLGDTLPGIATLRPLNWSNSPERLAGLEGS